VIPQVEPPGPERFGPWALFNYQLSQLLDALRRLEYVQAVAGGLKPDPEPPKPSPRPGLATVRVLKTAEQIAYLNAHRAPSAKGA
jgi:hypothetical protein